MDFSNSALDILEIIQSNPGIHFRAIIEKSNRQVGVVKHHLRVLEKEEVVIGIKHRNNLLYFDISYQGRIEQVKSLINYLRKTIPRNIILLLTHIDDQVTLKVLSNKMQKSTSSLHWHVKRMVEDNIINPVRKGREVSLKLRDPNLTKFLGKEIYPSRWDQFLDQVAEKFDRM